MLVVGDNSPAVEAVVCIRELFPLVTLAPQVTSQPCSAFTLPRISYRQWLFVPNSFPVPQLLMGEPRLRGPEWPSGQLQGEDGRICMSTLLIHPAHQTSDAGDPLQDRASFPELWQAGACSLVQVLNCCCFAVTLRLPGD